MANSRGQSETNKKRRERKTAITECYNAEEWRLVMDSFFFFYHGFNLLCNQLHPPLVQVSLFWNAWVGTLKTNKQTKRTIMNELFN